MNTILKIISGILLSGSITGIIMCNNPMTSKMSIASFNNTDTNVQPVNPIKYEDYPTAMRVVLSRVMFDSDGQAIGILFSTSKKEFCENRTGDPKGFFISRRTEQ